MNWIGKVLATGGLFAAVASAPAHAATAAAEIVSLEGKGEFREIQQTGWRPAAVRQSLFPTNFVRTSDVSRMGILFTDRTQVRLAPNSTLQIKESASGADTRTILNLNQGRSWVQSKATPRGLTMETPSALAAIRGTDWEMAVDAQGRAQLSVFSGEVELYNEHGRVLVAANEQASVEKGKAPVKLQLRTSRKRIQWVSSHAVDPSRYPDAASDAAKALLAADTRLFEGDTAGARAILERGARDYPGDDRFAAALSRLAQFEDEGEKAIELARALLARKPDSVEGLIALGDAARLEGRAREASAAYLRAIEVAAGDARGWHGAGTVESERENVARARSLLEKALALDAANPMHAAELGTLESFAGDFARARAFLEKAVQLQPDHYVAWTGLGVLALKSGDEERALEALLRATLVEPRYARAQIYLAAAYYQLERVEPALEHLRRAAELDPRDPLAHMLAAIVHLDAIEPGAAAQSAREALVRMPYLKSLNQIANNQKGVANVGAALAAMGLESWSRSLAHDSYLPFWGGSHLFLADRYPGEFNRRSELMQGFTTDPIAFGAANRFHSLFVTPGNHVTAALRTAHSDDLSAVEPVLTLNGYSTGQVPFSYFAEVLDTDVRPGSVAFDAHARTITAALGLRPVHEVSAFLYANRLSIDADLGTADTTGQFIRISGAVTRVDAGLRYAHSADSNVWFKAGAFREDSSADQGDTFVLPDFTLKRDSVFRIEPSGRDFGLRHTFKAADAWDLSWGAESSRTDGSSGLVRDAVLHFPGTTVPKESLAQEERDRADAAFALGRWKGGDAQLDLGVAWHDYRKDRDISAVTTSGPVTISESFRHRGGDPLLGGTLRMGATTARAACRRWARPTAPDMLMPVAIAGIALDDQLVLAGGELRQCDLRLDFGVNERVFASAAAGERRVENLASPLDGPLNFRGDVTNLDRLRNRVVTPPGKPDQLEDTPVYTAARIRRAHLALEAILSREVGARVHYLFADTENTGPYFPGKLVPYLPRHQANLGFTWAPGRRLLATVLANYRTSRFTDEANLVELPAGWDASVTLFAETQDKRWAVEAVGANLLKKQASDVFSVVVSYRF